MQTVYCFAVESESSGAVEWRETVEARDAALAAFPITEGDEVNAWSIEVPDLTMPHTITELADEAMWEREYVPILSYTATADVN